MTCDNHATEECQSKDASGSNSDALSQHPICYFNGSIHLEETDLESNGFGKRWGHKRSYANQLFDATPGTNGNGWFQAHAPVLLFDSDGSVGLVTSANRPRWFAPRGGRFSALFGGKAGLEHDADGNQYIFTDHEGGKTLFFGDRSPMKGVFKGIVSPNGDQTLARYNASRQIEAFVLESDDQSSGYHYEYYTGNRGLLPDQLRTVTHRLNGQNVRRCNYEYHGKGEPGGVQGDLKSAQVEQYDPASGTWFEVSKSHYRYYTTFASPGFPSGLKFVVGSEAYARMVKAGIQPETATDSELASYADYYFEYDFYQRVSRESVNGGALTYHFAYQESGNASGFNSWAVKTIETLPDGNQNTVYTNHAGQVMLKVFTADGHKQSTYYQYDEEGKGLLKAESSAVAAHNEGSPGLVTLKRDQGLIHTWEYYTDPSNPGYAPGYVKHARVQQGSAGTPVLLKTTQYVSRTVGGRAIYLPASEVVFQSEADGGSEPAETRYAYTFFRGQLGVQQQTKTLPAVPLEQNGSGVADSSVQVFDRYGNLTWAKDERGHINLTLRDAATGALARQIEDVDTAQVSGAPTGWTTPAGGGLHLVTDFQFDNQGRVTQALSPVHTVDLAGAETSIRRARWIVYRDDIDQVWQGNGYAAGDGSSGQFTLINPVTITQHDQKNRLTDTIEAVRQNGSGALTATDTLPQSTWSRWTHLDYNDRGQNVSKKVYFAIPETGSGTAGIHYNQTTYGYDVMGRQNRVVSPGGTIDRSLHVPCGCSCDCNLVLQGWTGTDDTGATDADPSGGGANGNNMALVVANEYDDGLPGGDDNLTKTTEYVDAATTRVTTYGYDYRNRKTYTDGELNYYEAYSYDNQDRLIQTDRRDTGATGKLLARNASRYNARGRRYQTLGWSVDPETGELGNALVNNAWSDPAGNVIKQSVAGSLAFKKSRFDGAGRVTAEYTAHNPADTGHPYPLNLDADTVLEQRAVSFDAVGNVIATVSARRFDDAAGTGALNGPNDAEPKARFTYTAHYVDGIGRIAKTAAYGTNGGAAWTRPGVAPAPSDTILVTSTEYNERGESARSINPRGIVTTDEYDDAGRVTRRVENVVAGGTGSDQNQETQFLHNADGKLAKLVSVNAATGDQVTEFVYGTTLDDSGVASRDLMRAKIFPDEDGSGRGTAVFAYNRLGEKISYTDQNGTVHEFQYDALGRKIEDRVTALGEGVDGRISRISRTYEPRGLLQTITSHAADQSVANQVRRSYDGLGNLVEDLQSHSGMVNPASTPGVRYTYEAGKSNSARRTAILYPNGASVSINYGSATADALSRADSLADSDGVISAYSYLGVAAPVGVTYPSAGNLSRTYENGGTGDAGDKYTGLDRFGRLVETVWKTGASEQVHSRLGRNRLGGVTWRRDEQARASGANAQDEFYWYDGLEQLSKLERGPLTGGAADYTGVSDTRQQEEWEYDATGNWSAYRRQEPANSQVRRHSQANVLTRIDSPSGSVAIRHNPVGDLLTLPVNAGGSTAQYSLVWDAWDRLVAVRSGNDTVASYAYDGLFRRVVTATADETREHYFNDQMRVIEERVQGSRAAVDRQYIWGLNGRQELILRRRSTGGLELNETHYVITDNLDPVAIAGADGTVVERYQYDGFGEHRVLGPDFTPRAASVADWNFLYHGEFRDAGTGSYNYGYRYYSAQLGRWLSRDPIAERGGLNLFGFVGNGSVNRRDYLGLRWVLGIKGHLDFCVDLCSGDWSLDGALWAAAGWETSSGTIIGESVKLSSGTLASGNIASLNFGPCGECTCDCPSDWYSLFKWTGEQKLLGGDLTIEVSVSSPTKCSEEAEIMVKGNLLPLLGEGVVEVAEKLADKIGAEIDAGVEGGGGFEVCAARGGGITISSVKICAGVYIDVGWPPE